jgi:allophanate hydrolase subunit 2
VDVPLAGQLRPGCPVRLVPVGLAEAERATARAERQIARAVQGRYPRWPT